MNFEEMLYKSSPPKTSWFNHSSYMEPVEEDSYNHHRRVSSYQDQEMFVSTTLKSKNKGSIASSTYRAGMLPPPSRSMLTNEMIRPNTNASAFTNDSLGLTQRSIASHGTQKIHIEKNTNAGLVSSRKQGVNVVPYQQPSRSPQNRQL